MFLGMVAFRIGVLAALIVYALVARGHGRCASLWQRAIAFGALGLIGAGGSFFPLLALDAAWLVTGTTVASGALSAALAIQGARAMGGRPVVQRIVGMGAAALGLMSAVQAVIF